MNLFGKDEIKSVEKVIKSSFVSTSGIKTDEFAKEIKKITKSKFVIPVINGTSALHIILKSLNINENHEVLLPTLTFVATGNAILYLNATPHFVDSEEESLGVNPDKLKNYLKRITKQTKRGCLNIKSKKIIKCIIVTHVFGRSANIEKIRRICNSSELFW